LKKLQFSICPNPDCKRSFENLIVIYDRSKNPPEKFYGCPYCFFKLDPTITGSLKKIEKIVKGEEPSNVTPSEEEIVSNCPEYFGYLADHISKSIIPRQCLNCEKMDNCMKNHNGNKKQ
jgi:hypothetical protein